MEEVTVVLRVLALKSMTFLWVFPIAGFNEYENTEDALRDGFLRVAFLIDFHD